jgi:hypothetical protein
MSSQAGTGVLQRAHELLMTVATVVGKQGDAGGFWQFYDGAPDDEAKQPEFGRERLDRTAARAALAKRIQAGFVGQLGFCCLGTKPMQLYAEVFDTRDPSQIRGTAQSVVLTLPLKKTWTGKYRAGAQGQLGGDAEALAL